MASGVARMAGGVTSSFGGSGSGNAAQSRARLESAKQSMMGGIFGGNSKIPGFGQAASTTATFNNNRDSNNINAGSGSGSQVSQAELNTPRDNNSGPGVLSAGMHGMNSSKPIVGGAKGGIETRQDMGYSSNVSPFSPSENEVGGAVFGSDTQRQKIMNPQPVGSIDQTGMNSLYGGPLKQQEKITSETKSSSEGRKKAPVKENNSRQNYRDDMIKQNDSLRSLPETDQNHLPTFDVTTDEGQAEATKFYTQDGNNKKLRRLQKLGKKLRTKHGINKK